MSWITITQGRLWQQLCDSLKGWKESLCAGEKQQELPRSYQGSKQSQEVTPILKDWRKKEKRVNGLPGAFVQQDPRYGRERGRLRVYSLRSFCNVPVKDKFSLTLSGIWTIIFRLEIFIGFWKELALTWSSVHNGLRLVWPPVHLLPHIFQISSCKRPDYFWLVKTSVNSTASYIYIYFYFIKIHKKFVWKQTRWSLFSQAVHLLAKVQSKFCSIRVC